MEYICKTQRRKIGWLCRSRGRRAAAKKLKHSRSEGANVVYDNLAGGWLASRKGRRLVEVRMSRWK